MRSTKECELDSDSEPSNIRVDQCFAGTHSQSIHALLIAVDNSIAPQRFENTKREVTVAQLILLKSIIHSAIARIEISAAGFSLTEIFQRDTRWLYGRTKWRFLTESMCSQPAGRTIGLHHYMRY